jgi:endonuclease G, mitochondrial
MVYRGILFLIIGLFFSGVAHSHGGKKNKEGCHFDKSVGEKHCHNDSKKTHEAKTKKAKSSNEIIKIDYEGFTIWLDCRKKGAIKFRYNAQRDTGNNKRHSKFYIDPKIDKSCQQTSTSSYKRRGKYDRGHLVPANHLDFSANAIKQSNYMINILPQRATMNRGAWLQTEEIVECYRDIDELLVIGGVIWGNNKKDDYFVRSHGVRTPDAFWKVIIRDQRVIAWIIPNKGNATRKRLDEYIVSVAELEKRIGEKIPVDAFLKEEKPKHSWQIPYGCNKG